MSKDRGKKAEEPAFPHRLIGLTGTNGAGKGEVAAYLMKKGYAYVSLSDEIRDELRRQGKEVAYYITAKGTAVDFVVPIPSEEGGHQILQVCADMRDPLTRTREVEAVRLAQKELRVRESTILTLLDEEIIGEDIEVVPLWRWLLSGGSVH